MNRDPTHALDLVRWIEGMPEFLENPNIRAVLHDKVPRPVPPGPGAWGFDIPLWVGLGMVGLWAALDAFAERAGLSGRCPICRGKCIPVRFSCVQGNDAKSLEELEDLRHLYAHNYAGEADDEYLKRPRHILARGVQVKLTCGASFAGVQLDLPDLRYYASAVRRVLQRFP
jgi:hypothetical protein